MSEGYSLKDILDAMQMAVALGLEVSMPGRVLSYKASDQTANVQPMLRKPVVKTGAFPGSEQGIDYIKMPAFPDVKVAFPKGGGFFVSFPLLPGDPVMLLFSSIAMGEYLTTGQESSPLDTRLHSLGYPIAIPGGASPDTKNLVDASATKLVIGKDGGQNQIEIDTAFLALGKGATDFVALASKVDAALVAIKAHAHASFGTPSADLAAMGTASGSSLVKAK